MIRRCREARVCFAALGLTAAVDSRGWEQSQWVSLSLCCVLWISMYVLSCLLTLCSCVLVFGRTVRRRATVRPLAGSSYSQSTVICPELLSSEGMLLYCQPWLCCCCFSAERSGIILKSVNPAGKNGAINEAFEMEVGFSIEPIYFPGQRKLF